MWRCQTRSPSRGARRSGVRCNWLRGKGTWIAAALALVLVLPFCTQAQVAGIPKRADFARERASRDARQLADWIVDSGDNRNLPFVIVDKTNARIFVFDPAGHIRGAAPALLGAARGDVSAPDIGTRELSAIGPEDRITPAGRFVAALGRNFRGEDVVWVYYDAGLSLHRVLTIHPEERRLQRLATRTVADNRISYGCINVPARFYEKVVGPAFTGTEGIVYVMPETRPAREIFDSYDVRERARTRQDVLAGGS